MVKDLLASPVLLIAFGCAAGLRAQEPLSPAFASPSELVRGGAALSSGAVRVPWHPESLEFEIKWGFLSVGWSTLKVQEVVDFAGRAAYHLLSEAQSNAFTDTFYKVRDINESWIDTGDLRSLGYSKKLREGSFFRDEWVVFDYAKGSFTSQKTDRNGAVSSSTGTIPGPVQDMLSSVYFLRPRRLNVGDEIVLDVNTKENWPLIVKVLRREKVRVPAGTFSTVVVEPAVRKEGIFIQKGKKLEVWLTDDEKHLPVLMRVEVFFGHVSAYLKKIG